jgi:hypothetical protein
MAVVNSEREAENLRHLYINYGSVNVQWNANEGIGQEPVTNTEPTTTQAPLNATVHIGFHDLFIEGEYLTVRGK